MPDEQNDKPSNLVPLLILAAVALLCLAGWWLFPVIQRVVALQDCIATGRTNC
jgi:hypothetical protein